MSIEQFIVQPPVDVSVNIVAMVLIALGVILMLISFSSRIMKTIQSIPFRGRYLGGNKYVLLSFGAVLIIAILVACASFYAPSTVTVGQGYLNVQFSNLTPIPFVDVNKNFTSNEIATAFVGNAGSGDFALSKQHGANSGDTNVGVYKLGNGATAYVASTNSTDLIIELNSGEYLILGNSNTDALAASFSKNVQSLTAAP